MIIDISQELFSCKVFPGYTAPEMKRVKNIEKGDDCNLTDLSMCVHNGTHIDVPFHFIKDGNTVEKMGLMPFVGDCYAARREGDITAEDVIDIMETARNAGASGRILLAGNVNVTSEAAQAFARANIRLLGIEEQSVGSAEIHNILLGAGICILEGVVLSDVMEGKYFLSAAPLNLSGCEGAPCRAYLIK